MSRIDKLIADLCPDGVEFVKIEDLFELKNGYTPSKSNSSFWENGTVPWFRMEDIRANGRILSHSLQQVSESGVKSGKLFPPNSLLVATSATIGEHALITVPHLSNQRFTSLSVKHKWKDQVDIKFLYHYAFILDKWCRANTTTSSFASVDMTGFKNFPIPIPPLEVQREIVRVLDKFTQLEAELEAELEARRRQYEHYRHRLFNAVEGATVEIGSLGVWRSGLTPSKSNPTYWESGNIPWLASMDVSNESSKEIRGRVTQIALEKTSLRLIPAPSLAVVFRSNILRRVLPIRLVDTDTTVNQDIRALVPSDLVDIEYAYQALRANSEQLRQNCVRTDGSMAAIDAKTFFSWEVPLPELAEQRLIARKLRRFDSLVNDLSIGLPAELAARRKQYEYYRDRLLTFEEKR